MFYSIICLDNGGNIFLCMSVPTCQPHRVIISLLITVWPISWPWPNPVFFFWITSKSFCLVPVFNIAQFGGIVLNLVFLFISRLANRPSCSKISLQNSLWDYVAVHPYSVPSSVSLYVTRSLSLYSLYSSSYYCVLLIPLTSTVPNISWGIFLSKESLICVALCCLCFFLIQNNFTAKCFVKIGLAVMTVLNRGTKRNRHYLLH